MYSDFMQLLFSHTPAATFYTVIHMEELIFAQFFLYLCLEVSNYLSKSLPLIKKRG